jgi:DNA repair photolyase
LKEVRHPFALVTKSSAIERDLDLIAPMAAEHLAAVYITVTTLDGELARKLEPRAAAPHRRLRTIRTLAEAGVPVGVSVAPQIPFVTEDMEHVLEAAWEAGARSAFYTVVRLPWEVAPLFKEWLQLHYPQRARPRPMARVHGDARRQGLRRDFATRMKGSGLWADLHSMGARAAVAISWRSTRAIFSTATARQGRRPAGPGAAASRWKAPYPFPVRFHDASPPRAPPTAARR